MVSLEIHEATTPARGMIVEVAAANGSYWLRARDLSLKSINTNVWTNTSELRQLALYIFNFQTRSRTVPSMTIATIRKAILRI